MKKLNYLSLVALVTMFLAIPAQGRDQGYHGGRGGHGNWSGSHRGHRISGYRNGNWRHNGYRYGGYKHHGYKRYGHGYKGGYKHGYYNGHTGYRYRGYDDDNFFFSANLLFAAPYFALGPFAYYPPPYTYVYPYPYPYPYPYYSSYVAPPPPSLPQYQPRSEPPGSYEPQYYSRTIDVLPPQTQPQTPPESQSYQNSPNTNAPQSVSGIPLKQTDQWFEMGW